MITYPNVKVNLGLNVLRKRPDGYHDLETLFLPYHEIRDVLEIVSGDDYSRTSAGLIARYGHPDGLCGDSGNAPQLVQSISPDGKVMITIARKDGVDWDPLEDLCVKAYRALDADFGLPPVKIYLEKLSPVGAGLGGGSADAAFAVRMLDGIFSIGLDEEKMAGYASSLGSDCAFFIYNKAMTGEGRGEILTPFSLVGMEILGTEGNLLAGEPGGTGNVFELKVIVPEGISVSTADAYRGIVPSVPETSLSEVLSMPVEIDIPGKFSVYNSLTAIAICLNFGVEASAIQSALKDVRVKGRVEIIPISPRFTLMIDYAHNAMALESLLLSLKEYHPKRLVSVFGCGGNRDPHRRFEMGEISSKLADLTVVTSDNPRFEEPMAIIEDILVGVKKGPGKYITIPDRKEAIRYCMTHAEDGDVIVLAGKGHEDYQEIKGVKYPMDERDLIADILKETPIS